MKLLFYKIRNWEFWPVYLVYAPSFFLWIWYAIKFRKVNFYKYSNPAIANGGLFGDSKFDIYNLLPEYSYPKTVLVKHEQKIDFAEELSKFGLTFPLIVKPDVGCRGVGVMQVKNLAELEKYRIESKINFLVQEVITLPNEIGLFYTRIPGQPKGNITGITVKEFMTVFGNGQSTIEELCLGNPRYEIQIPKLKSRINLNEILPMGEKRVLVPFGNHNRGTNFLDGKEYITPELITTFNAILSSIQGFYYGRLDIRFNTYEELGQGKNFSIIELNGAKSEPTHIYDPMHSFWYGQREILRHQRVFGRIVETVLCKN